MIDSAMIKNQPARAAARLIGLTLLGLILLYLIRYIPGADYTIKAGARMIVFILIIWAGRPASDRASRQIWQRLFRPVPFPARQLLLSLLGGLILLVVLYLLARPLADLFQIENVVREITERTGATRRSMIGIILYIPLVNALSEEIFFRGLLTGELNRLLTERQGCRVASVLFALYHLTIFRSWFSIPQLLLALTGLFVLGMVLSRLFVRNGHIYGVWILHAVLNLTIFAFALPFFPA